MAVAAAMLVAVLISVYLMQFSAGLVQRQRLQAAADLAALGAASYHVQGYGDSEACAVAQRIVAHEPDRAQVQCVVSGDEVTVVATARGVFSWLAPQLKVRAVAGPAP